MKRYSIQAYGSPALLVLFAFLAGCYPFRPAQVPRLSEAEVMRIASTAVREAAYPLTSDQAAAVHPSYDPTNGLWCMHFVVYTDRFPAGPIVCVVDRSGQAVFQPTM